jgi:hypothetical protein
MPITSPYSPCSLVIVVRDEEASPHNLCGGSSIGDRQGRGQRAVVEKGGL